MRCGVIVVFAPSTWSMIQSRSTGDRGGFQPAGAARCDNAERIAAERGYPRKLRLDNGPEMVSVTLADWAEQHHVLLGFIKPGRPMQNGFIERFNRSYREAVLDMFVFQSLSEVREQTELWLKEYKEERPHKSLGHLTPRDIC
jgi:putative transposase